MEDKKPDKTKTNGRADELISEIDLIRSEFDEVLAQNEKLKARIIELYTLYKVSRTMSMSLQLNELFDLAMGVIGESLDVAQYCLMLVEPESGQLVIHASHGLPENLVKMGSVVTEPGVVKQVVGECRSVLIDDMSECPEHIYFPESGIKAGSYLGVPLTGRDGKVLGALSAHKESRAAFSETDRRLFEAVAEHVAIAIDNALAYQQSRELMNRDDLTSLYNRRYFFDRLEKEVYRARRYGRILSLLMADIDHFKRYNDTFGHLRGDEALKKVAHTLEKRLRKADLIARYGGEEFLILLPETTKKDAARVADKLRTEIESMDMNEDAPALGPASLTVTFGVSSMPADADDALVLLDLADKALYYGKAQGRNQVCTEVPEERKGPE